MIDSLRGNGGAVVVVDGGDIVHPDSTRDDRYNQYVLHALGDMKYDAMTLGELDLYRGASYVRAMLDSTRVPVALANVRFADNHQPVGERVVLHRSGETTIAIVGLLGRDFGDGRAMSLFKDAGFEVDDPFEVAAALISEAKAKADLVVVLSHLTAAASRDLAKKVPGIDVLVIGHPTTATPPVQFAGASQPPGSEVERIDIVGGQGPVMVAGGERGQFLGKTRLFLDAKSRRLLAYGGAVTPLTLGDFPERRDLAEGLRKLHEVINGERKRTEMITELANSSKRLVSGQDHFLGDLRCARCHFDIYQEWTATRHAHAWKTLVDRHRDSDPECVSCHVTGISLPGGYKGVGATQDMRQVQCEACHGMGTLHDMSGMNDPEAGKPTCVRCHTGENSPEFDFPIYWSRIRH